MKGTRRFKPQVLTMKFFPSLRILEVFDARYESRSAHLPAVGNWPDRMQVDGRPLALALKANRSLEVLRVSASEREISFQLGNARFSIKRFDGTDSEVMVRAMPEQDHKGKVVVPPDPIFKRVELADTWGFTARVPMPQHRDKKI